MTWLQIPLPAAADITPNFSIQVDFDGLSYALRFAFNDKGAPELGIAPFWTVDLVDEHEREAPLVAGWKLEPIIPGDDFEDVLATLEAEDCWQLCVFGRFFRPGRLTAWASEPLTTLAGLAGVQLVYADIEEARTALAEAAA